MVWSISPANRVDLFQVDLPRTGSYCFGRFMRGVAVDVGDHHLRAGAGEMGGDGKPDAARGAGH